MPTNPNDNGKPKPKLKSNTVKAQIAKAIVPAAAGLIAAKLGCDVPTATAIAGGIWAIIDAIGTFYLRRATGAGLE